MQWDRNIAGKLERLSAPVEQGCEISLHTNRMETPPEEQQSQQGVQRDPNAYRSMRDHIHPPRVRAPALDFSWHGKRKSIYTHLGGSLHNFQRGCNQYGDAEVESFLIDPQRQSQNLA